MPSAMAHNPDDILDSELLIEPEQQYYQDGFREGQAQSTKESFLEGKQLGIQTGFQRFLIIGALRSLVDQLQDEVSSAPRSQESGKFKLNGKERGYDRTCKQLEDLRKMLDFFFEDDKLVAKNSAKEVEEYEKILKHCRARIRSLCTTLGFSELFAEIEQTCTQIGGEIPASSDTW